nr:hypothetical protein CFP56_24717 [Quercus suber]
MTAMTEFEDDLLLAWVCCCRLWLLLTGVHLLWVVAFDHRSFPPWVESVLRLGFEWVVGLNRLCFLGSRHRYIPPETLPVEEVE